jgi:hypothetical protein
MLLPGVAVQGETLPCFTYVDGVGSSSNWQLQVQLPFFLSADTAAALALQQWQQQQQQQVPALPWQYATTAQRAAGPQCGTTLPCADGSFSSK